VENGGLEVGFEIAEVPLEASTISPFYLSI
jgi:hypothetical protein